MIILLCRNQPSVFLPLSLLSIAPAVPATTWGWLTNAAAAAHIPDQDHVIKKKGSGKLNPSTVSEASHCDPVLGWPGRCAAVQGGLWGKPWTPDEQGAAPVRWPRGREGQHSAFRSAPPLTSRAVETIAAEYKGTDTRNDNDWWKLQALTQSQSWQLSNTINTLLSPTLGFMWTEGVMEVGRRYIESDLLIFTKI